MMTDPIADMLTRIRNAVRIERPLVEMPTSKMRRGIAQVLKDEGYIWEYEEIDTVPAKTLRLHMKYGPNGERLITRIDRVSKPGRRVYSGYKDLKPILGGMGIQILSTPRGVDQRPPRPRREGRRRGPRLDPLRVALRRRPEACTPRGARRLDAVCSAAPFHQVSAPMRSVGEDGRTPSRVSRSERMMVPCPESVASRSPCRPV